MFALQVITSRDIRSLLFAALLFVIVAATGLLLRRQIRSLLNEREWRIFFKLAAILGLALLLYFASISVQFPAEKFIYGRF